MARIVITVEYQDDSGKPLVKQAGYLDSTQPVSTGISQWLFEAISSVKVKALLPQSSSEEGK